MTVLAVVGPTASGKSSVAVELARRHGAEIVSVDSMQVYRGMDIGTAKPDLATRTTVTHHMIDMVEPSAEFAVAAFQTAGRAALDAIADRGHRTIVAGGSGLHLRALIDPMTFAPHDPEMRRRLETESHAALVDRLVLVDPGAGAVVDLDNPRRVLRAVEVHQLTGQTPTARSATPEHEALRTYQARVPVVMVGLDPGDGVADRIERRFDAMLASGLVDEVATLAPTLGRTAAQAVGYKELLPVIAGHGTLDGARGDAIRATRALAKRQRTFFRRDPRIRWISWADDPAERVRRALEIVEETPWIS